MNSDWDQDHRVVAEPRPRQDRFGFDVVEGDCMLSVYTNNFRCFSGEQTVPVRPLTLLVGENSTGKTSFLAAVRLAEKLHTLNEPPDFNEEPFKLGTFDEINNNQGGKSSRTGSFAIGSTFGMEEFHRGSQITQTTTFININATPTSAKLEYHGDRFNLIVERKDSSTLMAELRIEGYPEISRQFHGKNITDFFLFKYVMIDLISNVLIEPSRDTEADLRPFLEMMQSPYLNHPYAAAPVRAQPQRTYELLNDMTRSQGEHIPMILSQIYGHKEWESLREPLESFAKSSGLFDEISVKRLGKNEGSPFQIQVKINGPARNLIDVGYGVSQVLPLIVDLLRDSGPRIFLIQQPEVHLHPRAQAELGSFFASIVQSQGKQIFVETHSDYLIDRVRTCVREKTLKPSQVIILYFQRVKKTITIEPMELDAQGNFLSIPQNFRSFFMEEEKRNLGI